MPIGIIGATLIAAGVGAAASIYASNKQATAAQNALNLQRDTTQQALGLETGAYNTARGDLAPYRALGGSALGSIAQLYGFPNPTTGAPGTGAADYSAFYNSPDYQFAQQQGTLALERSAAAKGLLNSGGTLKDLTSFGQGLASQQYGNYFNRLASLAGLGQTAAAGSAQAAQAFGQTAGATVSNFGNNAAATTQNLGAAQASGAVGIANALSTLPQNLLYAQYFGQGQSPSGYAASGYPSALSPGQVANTFFPGSGSMAYGNIGGPYNGFGP